MKTCQTKETETKEFLEDVSVLKETEYGINFLQKMQYVLPPKASNDKNF